MNPVFRMRPDYSQRGNLTSQYLSVESDDLDLFDDFDLPTPIAGHWNSIEVSVKLKKKPPSFYWVPAAITFAVTQLTRDILEQLVSKNVEYLRLSCVTVPDVQIMHIMAQVPLGPNARLNETGTVIHQYDFADDALTNQHCFRPVGYVPHRNQHRVFNYTLVSDAFRQLVKSSGFTGVAFSQVFPNVTQPGEEV